MKILLFISIILLQCVGTIEAQNAPYIADFYNNKDAAISITFDDASYGQYEYAFPILNKYNFTATFSVIGEWFCINPSPFSGDGLVYYNRLSKANLLVLWSKGN